jgi:hypothetical protein
MEGERMIDIDITVTQSDIASGRRGSACECPVAQAIKRTLVADFVSVSLNQWVTQKNGVYYKSMPLPDIAAEWYHAFDADEAVSPFSFTLAVPDDLVLDCCTLR